MERKSIKSRLRRAWERAIVTAAVRLAIMAVLAVATLILVAIARPNWIVQGARLLF